MSEQYKKAFESAEQEIQDREVERLKGIIKNLLQKKKDKEDSKREIEEAISVIKNDIDDFKKGRLDKIKERHDTDPKANSASPINITIINDNSRLIYPAQPWRWNYEVVWNNYQSFGTLTSASNSIMTTTGGNAVYLSQPQGMSGTAGGTLNNAFYSMTGATAANFVGGTYDISGKIINL